MMLRLTNKHPEYKSSDVYAVTIKIYIWIKRQAYHSFQHSSLWGEMSKINPVAFLFSVLWSI